MKLYNKIQLLKNQLNNIMQLFGDLLTNCCKKKYLFFKIKQVILIKTYINNE